MKLSSSTLFFSNFLDYYSVCLRFAAIISYLQSYKNMRGNEDEEYAKRSSVKRLRFRNVEDEIKIIFIYFALHMAQLCTPSNSLQLQ